MTGTALNGYLQVGHGPCRVLAMSGWFGDASDWLTVAQVLDPERFTFVLFDYRGYGRSRHIAGAYTFEESAADVLRLADQLGWDRFSLLGHSMSGAAIQRVLLAAPERIERMIAVAAVPACGSRMDPQRLTMFQAAVDDVAKRAFIINFSTGKRLPETWVSAMARRSFEISTRDAFAGYLPQWATQDFSELVHGNETPVLVLIGEHDPTLTAELMRSTWLSWYPRAELEMLGNSGHYPMYEVPLALAARVAAFLQQ